MKEISVQSPHQSPEKRFEVHERWGASLPLHELLNLKEVSKVVRNCFHKILKQFGERVQKLRKDQGISQEELAEKVGVHRTYMGFIERGERNPSLLKIYKIVKALKTSSSKLLPF